VPLISGTACAIPAIMGSRNIENWKERLITILVTPFITCSARLPVYAILIALIIPQKRIFGFLSLQGLTLMVLYLLGFGVALFSAYILNKILKISSKSYFVVEMPSYKIPLFKNVAINILEKTKAFVFGAGKIILAISVILWFLGSHGPKATFGNAEKIVSKKSEISQINKDNLVSEYKLEHSYIGILGKSIEPAIKPLGYDWKIGIAVVSSFAAREVFVGTLATIYSVGSHSDEEETIKEQMKNEVREDGKNTFNFATGVSLLLFYAFAMQCVSTLAIVKKETNSWKWPIIQLVFMSGFAYLTALLAYQILK
jgi:ferrous iron transport protein B